MDFTKQPMYCFTSDLDWVTEEMIKNCFDVQHKVPLTPFVTHPSHLIDITYPKNKKRYVGVHPNFRSDSTQGNNPEEVLQYIRKLQPFSKFYRCHGFYEDTNISRMLFKAGYRFNSNLALHLQDRIIPLKHQSGSLCFPVFLEDDYLLQNGPMKFYDLEPHLTTPGLKIFNFHPVHIHLNTPNMKYYELAKRTGTFKPFQGEGIRTILEEIIDFVHDQSGLGIYYLTDIYEMIQGQAHDNQYSRLAPDDKAEEVKKRYNSIDSDEIYATSRDFNMRELEIKFILENLREGLKVLDLGCGNGYTDIRIAQQYDSEVTGLDISQNQLDGATKLAKRFEPLKGRLDFLVYDCRKHLPYDPQSFDAVVTERFLLNLPDWDTQRKTLKEIHRILKNGGTYVMVEGSLDGLENMNKLRINVGLQPIPDRSEDNVSSLKFREKQIETELYQYFEIEKKCHWGTYFLISRVAHPLLVAPQEPKWSAEINKVARKIAEQDQEHNQFGHLVGYILRRRGLRNKEVIK